MLMQMCTFHIYFVNHVHCKIISALDKKKALGFPSDLITFHLNQILMCFPLLTKFLGVSSEFCAINISHRRIKREAFLQLFLKSLQKRVEKALEPETHQNFALSSHQREKSKFHQAKKLVRKGNSEK